MRKFLKPLSFLPAIVLMYLIFTFSDQTGETSSQLSFKVSRKIIQTADYVFDAGLDDTQVDRYAVRIDFITRKLAHMTEYFLLAIAVSFPLYVYGMHGILLTLTAGLVCVAFACSDEFHQSMVAGRSPSVRDVCIDSVGVLAGIILVRITGWAGRHTLFRPLPKKKKKAPKPAGTGSEAYGCGGEEFPYDAAYPQGQHTPYPAAHSQEPDIPYKGPDSRSHPEKPGHPPKKKKEKDWFFDL